MKVKLALQILQKEDQKWYLWNLMPIVLVVLQVKKEIRVRRFAPICLGFWILNFNKK